MKTIDIITFINGLNDEERYCMDFVLADERVVFIMGNGLYFKNCLNKYLRRLRHIEPLKNPLHSRSDFGRMMRRLHCINN